MHQTKRIGIGSGCAFHQADRKGSALHVTLVVLEADRLKCRADPLRSAWLSTLIHAARLLLKLTPIGPIYRSPIRIKLSHTQPHQGTRKGIPLPWTNALPEPLRPW